jgi:hypothetical protein
MGTERVASAGNYFHKTSPFPSGPAAVFHTAERQSSTAEQHSWPSVSLIIIATVRLVKTGKSLSHCLYANFCKNSYDFFLAGSFVYPFLSCFLIFPVKPLFTAAEKFRCFRNTKNFYLKTLTNKEKIK